MKKMLLAAAAAVAVSAPAVAEGATVVTNYNTNFRETGWSYLWNAPSDWNGTSSNGSTGAITSIADFEPLVYRGSPTNQYTATGTATPTPEPAGYLSLTAFNAHPGRGSSQAVTGSLAVGNSHARYVIAAYTVAEAGEYEIVDSEINRTSTAAGTVDIRVFTNDTPSSPALTKTISGVSDFDTTIGALDAGDTIYVAFGAGTFDSNDFFTLDYSIALVPEPGAVLMLGGLGVLGLIRRR